MTTLTITNISNKIIPSSEYTAEELIKVLFNKLDYFVELDNFSDIENRELLEHSSWRYDKISNLID